MLSTIKYEYYCGHTIINYKLHWNRYIGELCVLGIECYVLHEPVVVLHVLPCVCVYYPGTTVFCVLFWFWSRRWFGRNLRSRLLKSTRFLFNLTMKHWEKNDPFCLLYTSYTAEFELIPVLVIILVYNYCTCVNVPSVLMLAMEPPPNWLRSSPTLSWVVLCWEGKWMFTLARSIAQIPLRLLE